VALYNADGPGTHRHAGLPPRIGAPHSVVFVASSAEALRGPSDCDGDVEAVDHRRCGFRKDKAGLSRPWIRPSPAERRLGPTSGTHVLVVAKPATGARPPHRAD